MGRSLHAAGRRGQAVAPVRAAFYGAAVALDEVPPLPDCGSREGRWTVNRTAIPYLDFCWNPGGFGCSHGCPTCWARRIATTGGPTAPQCPQCRQFAVHWHEDRLEGKLAPAARKKPAVVGVQFTGDLFDPVRMVGDIYAALDAMHAAPQHEYVLLTRQYERSARLLQDWSCRRPDGALTQKWHIGTTCQTQADYDAAAMCFAGSAWNWWVSAEPLMAPITPDACGYDLPECIILGADNQVSAPYSVEWHRSTLAVFSARGVPCYMKQLWMLRCSQCDTIREDEPPAGGCDCLEPRWVRFLNTDLALMPDDLFRRDLPWTLTMGGKA